MRYIVVVGVVALVALCKADGVDMDRDDCSKSMSRTITMEPVNPDSENYSGSPILMRVSGVASTSNFAVDVDDVKLQVKVSARIGGAFSDSDLGTAEFELDLCTDVVGVKCPMLDGTPFDGVASWNSVQVPDNRGMVGNLITLTVKESAAPACSEARVVEPHAGLFFPSTMAYSRLPAISKWRTVSLNRRHGTSWTAEMSPRFEGMTLLDARRIAGGTVMRGQLGFEELPYRRHRTAQGGADIGAATKRSIRATKGGAPRFSGVTSDIPDSFDAREAFPECAPVIGRVRDQSDCGSCWAFASTEAFNDRRCIAGIGKDGGSAAARADQLLVLSAEDTTACCHGIFCGLSMGCNGGQPGSAWKWFARKGVVTGGDYADVGQGTTCKPYEFQPCAHHVDPGASGYPACPDGEYPTPECRTECSEDTFGAGYEADKKLAKEAYSLGGIEDIQLDMLQFGSVTAAFSVYSDFLTYSGGVYNHIHGSYLGGHAVKIIGWGTDADSGEDYWLVVNSWNPSWGEGGMFRILRGVNECGIEGQIVAGEV